MLLIWLASGSTACRAAYADQSVELVLIQELRRIHRCPPPKLPPSQAPGLIVLLIRFPRQWFAAALSSRRVRIHTHGGVAGFGDHTNQFKVRAVASIDEESWQAHREFQTNVLVRRVRRVQHTCQVVGGRNNLLTPCDTEPP